MRFSMLYSGEQILSFKPCLVFYAGDSLSKELLNFHKGLPLTNSVKHRLNETGE